MRASRSTGSALLSDGSKSVADWPVFTVGAVVAFISAYACVRWLLRYIASHTFVPFAWYRIAFGVVVLVTAWTGVVHWAD